MKKKIVYIISSLFVVALIGSGFAFAQSKGLSILEGIPGITLTDAQMAKLSAKDADHEKKMIRLRADHQVVRVDVDNLLKERNFKKEEAEKLIRNMKTIETDMELERLAQVHELRGVLTDAQWKIYSAHAGYMGCLRGGNGAMRGDCPMGYGKDGMRHGKGMGMGTGMGKGMGKGMANCPYMKDTTTDSKTK